MPDHKFHVTQTVFLSSSAYIVTKKLPILLGGPPMIGFLLIIQVPHASNKRRVPLTLSPIDGFSLRFEGAEHVVGVVFDNIILDVAPFTAALGAQLNIHVRHDLLSLVLLLRNKNYTEPNPPVAPETAIVRLRAEAKDH